VETTGQQPAVPTLTQAMNRADELNGPFMDYLLRQVKDAQLENERLERENRDLRDENARLRWQRGT
jgi:FtsZ-binding cell division protein ZapB